MCRAIPWIFAWTQTRLQLPVWLGIGSAFKDAIARGKLSTLQDMYANWPFFAVTLDLVEMVLAKASPRIAQLYDEELLKEPELQQFGAMLRDRLADTEKSVLQVTQRKSLLEVPAAVAGGQSLKQTLAQRAPYILPLNMLQARRVRRHVGVVLSVVGCRVLFSLCSTSRLPARSRCAPQVRYLQLERDALSGEVTDKTASPEGGQKVPWGRELMKLNVNESDLLNAIQDTLMITVKGIAAGMQNTG